jgi:hypothetical protein
MVLLPPVTYPPRDITPSGSEPEGPRSPAGFVWDTEAHAWGRPSRAGFVDALRDRLLPPHDWALHAGQARAHVFGIFVDHPVHAHLTMLPEKVPGQWKRIWREREKERKRERESLFGTAFKKYSHFCRAWQYAFGSVMLVL